MDFWIVISFATWLIWVCRSELREENLSKFKSRRNFKWQKNQMRKILSRARYVINENCEFRWAWKCFFVFTFCVKVNKSWLNFWFERETKVYFCFFLLFYEKKLRKISSIENLSFFENKASFAKTSNEFWNHPNNFEFNLLYKLKNQTFIQKQAKILFPEFILKLVFKSKFD